MEENTINHPRLRVSVKTGSEGPSHDPYAYTEYHVDTPAGTTILHEGLVTWLQHNDYKIEPATTNFNEYERWMREDGFQMCTGYRLEALDRISRHLAARCSNCRIRAGWQTETGYPGEYLYVCENCGHIRGGYFNHSEIE